MSQPILKTFWNAFREPINSLTHWFGALKGLIGLGVLCFLALRLGVNPWPFVVFGLSMVLLYTASASYHTFRVGERGMLWLRKLDHSAIFLLIAGSFTPVVLLATSGTLQTVLIVLIWTLSVLGIGMKLWTMKLPRWISTLIYLGMGWLAVFVVPPLWQAGRWDVLAWLVAGGLLYTAGGIVYGTKKLNPYPGVFGFHEIWHLFVLAGSSAHFFMVLSLLPVKA